MSQEQEVIVTGIPGRPTINRFGKKIFPGVLVRMSLKEAEVNSDNLFIVERLVEKLEVPKPQKPEKPVDAAEEKLKVPKPTRREKEVLARADQGQSDLGIVDRAGV